MANWEGTPPSPPTSTAPMPRASEAVAVSPAIPVFAAPGDSLHIVPEFKPARLNAEGELTAITDVALEQLLTTDGILEMQLLPRTYIDGDLTAIGAMTAHISIPQLAALTSTGVLEADYSVKIWMEKTEVEGTLTATVEPHGYIAAPFEALTGLSSEVDSVGYAANFSTKGKLSAMVRQGDRVHGDYEAEGDLSAWVLVAYVRQAAWEALGEMDATRQTAPGATSPSVSGDLTADTYTKSIVNQVLSCTGTVTVTVDGFELNWRNQGGTKIGNQQLGASSSIFDVIYPWTDRTGYVRDNADPQGMGYVIPPGDYIGSGAVVWFAVTNAATYGLALLDDSGTSMHTFQSGYMIDGGRCNYGSTIFTTTAPETTVRLGARCSSSVNGNRVVAAGESYFTIERLDSTLTGPSAGAIVTGGEKSANQGWSKVLAPWGPHPDYPSSVVASDGTLTYPGGQMKVTAKITNSGGSTYKPPLLRMVINGTMVSFSETWSNSLTQAVWMGTIPADAQVWMEIYSWQGYSNTNTVSFVIEPIGA